MAVYAVMKFIFMLLLPLIAFKAGAQSVPTRADTAWSIDLPNHDVNGERVWHNDTARYRYNQMRYNVTVVLPYVKEGTRIFSEIDSKLAQPGLSRKERKHFIAAKEAEIKTNFEDKVKHLNTTQGVLLIKLIARQTGANLYQILQETKGTLGAVKYQVWAKFNGFNLNRNYHPEEETDLEHIMIGLGFPLPASYGLAK